MLGEWLVEAGAEIELRRPAVDPMPMTLDDYVGVVCLGGRMGAEDDREYPWLAGVRRMLAMAATRHVPTLAVCLGAQLLAVATGGRAQRGADGPEAGPSLVSKKDAGFADPLFGDVPLLPDVVQFHQDVISQLPPGAELLASSPTYPHQAYRLNRCLYGIQFHIETTPAMVRDWVEQSPEIAAAAKGGAFESGALAAAHEDLAEVWQPFVWRFVQFATGELPGADGSRQALPLV